MCRMKTASDRLLNFWVKPPDFWFDCAGAYNKTIIIYTFKRSNLQCIQALHFVVSICVSKPFELKTFFTWCHDNPHFISNSGWMKPLCPFRRRRTCIRRLRTIPLALRCTFRWKTFRFSDTHMIQVCVTAGLLLCAENHRSSSGASTQRRFRSSR